MTGTGILLCTTETRGGASKLIHCTALESQFHFTTAIHQRLTTSQLQRCATEHLNDGKDQLEDLKHVGKMTFWKI